MEGNAQAAIHLVLRNSPSPRGAQDAVVPPHIRHWETEAQELFQEVDGLVLVLVSAEGDLHEQEKC